MPIDLSGIKASRSVPILPTSSTGPVEPTRALVPLAPISPVAPKDDISDRPAAAFDRSGLDLFDVFTDADQLISRQMVAPVELEVGLEQARMSLLRQRPADALASLDQIWQGACRTEEGWYLRSGALMILGLPAEGDRIASAGLDTKPTSLALRFVRSLARLAMGDSTGARLLLQPTVDGEVADPLIRVQHAITQARQGDRAGAEHTLAVLAEHHADHPALSYGRGVLRLIGADLARQYAQPTLEEQEVFAAFGGAAPTVESPIETPEATPVAGIVATGNATDEPLPDVAEQALRQFGVRMGLGATSDIIREARVLLRAFSSGGALAGSVMPQVAYAARGVLTAVLSALSGDRTAGQAPLRTLIEQLIPSLQSGRPDEAERVLQRARNAVREPQLRLLRALSQLESGASPAVPAVPAVPASPVVSELRGSTASREPGPLIPVRLGLALLVETAGMRQDILSAPFAPMNEASEWLPRADGVVGRVDQYAPSARLDVQGKQSEERSGRGWGAALAAAQPAAQGAVHAASRAAADLHATRDETQADVRQREAAGARSVAVLLIAAAAVAMATGRGEIAIACGAGAAWLGLRRNSGD